MTSKNQTTPREQAEMLAKSEGRRCPSMTEGVEKSIGRLELFTPNPRNVINQSSNNLRKATTELIVPRRYYLLDHGGVDGQICWSNEMYSLTGKGTNKEEEIYNNSHEEFTLVKIFSNLFVPVDFLETNCLYIAMSKYLGDIKFPQPMKVLRMIILNSENSYSSFAVLDKLYEDYGLEFEQLYFKDQRLVKGINIFTNMKPKHAEFLRNGCNLELPEEYQNLHPCCETCAHDPILKPKGGRNKKKVVEKQVKKEEDAEKGNQDAFAELGRKRPCRQCRQTTHDWPQCKYLKDGKLHCAHCYEYGHVVQECEEKKLKDAQRRNTAQNPTKPAVEGGGGETTPAVNRAPQNNTINPKIAEKIVAPKSKTAEKAERRKIRLTAQRNLEQIERKESEVGTVSYHHTSKIETRYPNLREDHPDRVHVVRRREGYQVERLTLIRQVGISEQVVLPCNTQPTRADVPLTQFGIYNRIVEEFSWSDPKPISTVTNVVHIPANLFNLPPEVDSRLARCRAEEWVYKWIAPATVEIKSPPAHMTLALLPRYFVEEEINNDLIAAPPSVSCQHDELGRLIPKESNLLSYLFGSLALLMFLWMVPYSTVGLGFLPTLLFKTLTLLNSFLTTTTLLKLYGFIMFSAAAYLFYGWRSSPIQDGEGRVTRLTLRQTIEQSLLLTGARRGLTESWLRLCEVASFIREQLLIPFDAAMGWMAIKLASLINPMLTALNDAVVSVVSITMIIIILIDPVNLFLLNCTRILNVILWLWTSATESTLVKTFARVVHWMGACLISILYLGVFVPFGLMRALKNMLFFLLDGLLLCGAFIRALVFQRFIDLFSSMEFRPVKKQYRYDPILPYAVALPPLLFLLLLLFTWYINIDSTLYLIAYTFTIISLLCPKFREFKGWLEFESVLIAPYLEETLKSQCWWAHILIGAIETRSPSFYALAYRIANHYAISHIGGSFETALLTHMMLNFIILYSQSRGNKHTFALQIMILFTTIVGHVGQGMAFGTFLIINALIFTLLSGFQLTEVSEYRATQYLYGYGLLEENTMLKKRAAGNPVAVAMTRKGATSVSAAYKNRAEGALDPRGVRIAPPHPTTNSPKVILEGYVGRLCSETVEPDPEVFKELETWVQEKFLPRIATINESNLISMQDYLKTVNKNKQKQYAAAYEKFCKADPQVQKKLISELGVHGAFTKSEFYEKVTDSRAIYTPDDLAKCLYGWMFSQIEQEIYKMPEIVKHIPVNKRAAYIKNRLRRFRKFLETDFTSLEGSISQKWMEKIEFLVYKHFFKNCSQETRELVDQLLSLLSSTVVTKTKWFKTSRVAGRHSGAMNTALGNVLTNIILITFLFETQGIDFLAVFEGDDGLINCDTIPDLTVLRKLGFKVTFDVADNIGELSFCGMRFGPSGQTMTNPFMVISKLTFIPKQYMLARQKLKDHLIALKCISHLFEHPNCPMSSAYARQLLIELGTKVSKSTLYKLINKSQISQYERKRLSNALDNFDDQLTIPKIEINYDTRLLFQRTYGVSPYTQMLFERDPLSELSRTLFSRLCPVEWIHNTQMNVSDRPNKGLVVETIYQGVYYKNADLNKIVCDVEADIKVISKNEIQNTKKSFKKLTNAVLNHPSTGPRFISHTFLSSLIRTA